MLMIEIDLQGTKCCVISVQQGVMEKALVYFERSKEFDNQSLYMLSVMLYDGIGCKPDTVSSLPQLVLCFC